MSVRLSERLLDQQGSNCLHNAIRRRQDETPSITPEKLFSLGIEYYKNANYEKSSNNAQLCLCLTTNTQNGLLTRPRKTTMRLWLYNFIVIFHYRLWEAQIKRKARERQISKFLPIFVYQLKLEILAR